MSSLYEPLPPHELENFTELLETLKLPLTGSLIRRIFLLLLRAHYGVGSNYPQEYAHLRNLIWSPDELVATLTLDVINHYDDTQPDQYPGIYVGVASNSSSTQVLGGYAGASDDTSRQIVVSEDVATVRMIHLARNEGDAIDMADMSMTFLKAMAPFFAPDMQASAVRISGYSEARKKMVGAERFYAVDLSAQVTYNRRVATILEGHRIAALQLAVKSNATTLS